jgi:hypothetical protein
LTKALGDMVNEGGFEAPQTVEVVIILSSLVHDIDIWYHSFVGDTGNDNRHSSFLNAKS